MSPFPKPRDTPFQSHSLSTFPETHKVHGFRFSTPPPFSPPPLPIHSAPQESGFLIPSSQGELLPLRGNPSRSYPGGPTPGPGAQRSGSSVPLGPAPASSGTGGPPVGPCLDSLRAAPARPSQAASPARRCQSRGAGGSAGGRAPGAGRGRGGAAGGGGGRREPDLGAGARRVRTGFLVRQRERRRGGRSTDGDLRGPRRGRPGAWGRVRGRARPRPGLRHAARCQSDRERPRP